VKVTAAKTSKTAREEIVLYNPCLRALWTTHATFVPLSSPAAELHTWFQCVAFPFLVYLRFELWSCKRDKVAHDAVCVC